MVADLGSAHEATGTYWDLSGLCRSQLLFPKLDVCACLVEGRDLLFRK